MSRLTIISVFLIFLSSNPANAETDFEASFYWPLKLNKQFSSGFGDSRPGRFHKGVDLRTGGEEGAKVFAPEDGYVWAIKTSYRGYGKSLYIKGESGRIYVFYHLQRYNQEIGTYLRKKQVENRRYYQVLFPEARMLPVKKGDFIARTGQTGVGAPHLHFEVRDADDRPTNPLYYRIDLADRTAPIIQAVWLTYLDDNSLFDNGEREIKLAPIRQGTTNTYHLPDTLVVIGQVAFKVAIEDIVGPGSFGLGPSRVSLRIDGRLYHEVDYDRLDFDDDLFSVLDRDFDPAKKEEYKRVFNLYRKRGNRLSNYRSDLAGDGSFADTLPGPHTGVIEAADSEGNIGRLEFTFYYLPGKEILAPFNRAEFYDSLIAVQFETDVDTSDFDSVAFYLTGETSSANSTVVSLSPEIELTGYAVTLRGNFGLASNYHLQFFRNGHPYPAYHLSTEQLNPIGEAAVDTVSATIIGQGIQVTARAFSDGINWLLADFITDRGSDRIFYRKTGERRFSLYYRPDSAVRSIEAVVTRGPVGFRPDTLLLGIRRFSAGEVSGGEILSGCRLAFDSGDLFDDVLVAVRDTVMPVPQTGFYVYAPFIVDPATCSFADWADLQTLIDPETVDPAKVGLYVFEEEEGWLWAGGEYDSATGWLHSQLGGGGLVAVMADTTPPVISQLSIEDGGRVKIGYPPIEFRLEDELSGIEDDLNFEVTIDDAWIVPEYDPERKTFIGKPHWRLHGGPHTLRIEVRDRCGNQTVVTRKFLVRAITGP